MEKKHSFGQFVQLLEVLDDPTNYDGELHQISEILEIFDPEYDGESDGGKYPVELAKWVEEKGKDNFIMIINGWEMSQAHLGGDDFVEMMDDILRAICSDGYKFFYTWYGDNGHAVTIGTRFQLGDDFRAMVKFNENAIYGEDEIEGYVQVTEYCIGGNK